MLHWMAGRCFGSGGVAAFAEPIVTIDNMTGIAPSAAIEAGLLFPSCPEVTFKTFVAQQAVGRRGVGRRGAGQTLQRYKARQPVQEGLLPGARCTGLLWYPVRPRDSGCGDFTGCRGHAVAQHPLHMVALPPRHCPGHAHH